MYINLTFYYMSTTIQSQNLVSELDFFLNQEQTSLEIQKLIHLFKKQRITRSHYEKPFDFMIIEYCIFHLSLALEQADR